MQSDTIVTNAWFLAFGSNANGALHTNRHPERGIYDVSRIAGFGSKGVSQ